MSGSIFGKLFTVTTFGESHGRALGAVIDGCPAGIALSEEDIAARLRRRKPGQSSITTPRNEADAPIILSGVFEGRTTGTPICVIVENQNQKSKDYDALKDIYRPSHADYPFQMKYGHRDHRGGGRSSGRETVGRVIAGAVAAKFLEQFGIETFAYTRSVGPYTLPPGSVNRMTARENRLYMPDAGLAAEAIRFIEDLAAEGDSVGGTVECITEGLPVGLGETVFRKLDALLGQALFSIGGVKAVEVGSGTEASEACGSDYNDAFVLDNGVTRPQTNHSGGVLGGMSSGAPLVLRAHFKPTPSISKPQQTVRTDGTATEISIQGRHDPVIFPRAVVVVESMVNLVLADLLLENTGANIQRISAIYDF